MNSSFLVPKSWNRYGCETPARRAMASVEVPARPPCENSVTAAATTSSRRSSADRRVVDGAADMVGNLVSDKFLVKPHVPGAAALAAAPSLAPAGNPDDRGDREVASEDRVRCPNAEANVRHAENQAGRIVDQTDQRKDSAGQRVDDRP